jgi:hypothetical protein
MGSASRRLQELGIGGGDRVLFCSMLAEAGQFWPWIVGVMLSNAQLSCADATAAEAARVAMFCRLITYRAVVGVTDMLLDGLADRGVDPVECFAGVEIVAARPGAYERLVVAGLTPYRFALCGPAVAFGSKPGGPAVVDEREWQLDNDERDARVRVTNLLPRATTFSRSRVAISARVVDDGKGITWADGR